MLPLLGGLLFGTALSTMLFKATDKSGQAQTDYYKMKQTMVEDQQKREREATRQLEQQSIKPGGRQRQRSTGAAILGSPYLVADSFLFSL